MVNYNSPEKIDHRKNQGDPIVMYLIVRESLNMSAGKIGAQCAHAAQMVLLRYMNFSEDTTNVLTTDQLSIMQEWLETSFRKVVLKADEKEWAKLKESNEIISFLVHDAGFTEVEAGSETVIGLWPIRKSLVPKVVKKLQVMGRVGA